MPESLRLICRPGVPTWGWSESAPGLMDVGLWMQGILDVLKWELPAEQFERLCNMSEQATVPLAERAHSASAERSYSATYF